MQPPYVLPRDQKRLDGWPPSSLRFDVLPAPMVGDPRRARVWLLMLNPGFAEGELEDEEGDNYYRAQRRLALIGQARYPFWPLDPDLSWTVGGRYWANRL